MTPFSKQSRSDRPPASRGWAAVAAVSWYIARDGQKVGPFTPSDLKQLACAGLLLPTELIWSEGMPKWVEASRFVALFPAGGQKRYWLSQSSKTRGPFPADLIRAALAGKLIDLETLACPEGDTTWAALSQFPEFRQSALSSGTSSQARLLAGTLDAEEAELYLAAKDGDAIARLISTLIDLKKTYAGNAGLLDSLERSIQVLKAKRGQTAVR